MNRITIDIDNAKIDDVAKLIEEISEDIRTSQGAALEDLSKKNRWRDRLKELCSFSKNNQKVILKDIYDTNILLQLLTVLSKKIYESHNGTLVTVLNDLECLQDEVQALKDFKSEIKKVLDEEIQKLRDFYSKKVKIQNRNDLDEDNQNLLISILEYIAELKVSDLQKDLSKQDQEYINAITLFFGKGAVDVEEFNISENTIGEIDNREQAKIFYSFVLEAIAVLYDENKENPLDDVLIKSEVFACIFDELDLAPKYRKEIEATVRKEIKRYNKLEDHFVRKYETVADVEEYLFDEHNFVFCEEDTDNDDSIEDEFNCSDDDTEEEFFEEVEKTEETISTILQIAAGEEKVFRNKILHFNAFVNCSGNLILDNCVIYYNEKSSSDEITINRNSNLTIKNSTVICKGFDKSHFIKCEGKNQIVIESSIFEDCSYFLYCGNDNKFIVNNCYFKNCYSELFHVYGKDAKISNNLIINSDINGTIYSEEYLSYWTSDTMFEIRSYSDCETIFENNYVNFNGIKEKKRKRDGLLCVTEESIGTRISFLDSEKAVISNCTFIGMQNKINAKSISNSRFINCEDILDNSCYDETNSVTHCYFDTCTKIARMTHSIALKDCCFENCFDLLFEADWRGGIRIMLCHFVNLSAKYTSFEYNFLNDKESKPNYMEKCIFDGIDLYDKFFIAPSGYAKSKRTTLYIEDCDFRNVKLNKNSIKLISKTYNYYPKFSKNGKTSDSVVTVYSSCKGMDTVGDSNGRADQTTLDSIREAYSNVGATINEDSFLK